MADLKLDGILEFVFSQYFWGQVVIDDGDDFDGEEGSDEDDQGDEDDDGITEIDWYIQQIVCEHMGCKDMVMNK